jgi:inosose dehydratase
MPIRVANAPCSWGVLEFDGHATSLACSQVLDQLAATGYAGTELGDWGFMPTDPPALRADIERRGLTLVGAFVPVALSDARAHADGIDRAVRTATLLRDAGYPHAFVVLADMTDGNARRIAIAGRVGDDDGLSPGAWDVLAQGANAVARAVRDRTGVRTVFHPHCGSFVETAREVEMLMSRTDPALLGLCLDTGHLTYAGGDPVLTFERYRDRVWHLHFKDCEPRIAADARRSDYDYFTAVRNGVFCELGRGSVDFPRLVSVMRDGRYDGWIVVEQDVLPALGTPEESARRNRDFLRTLGL